MIVGTAKRSKNKFDQRSRETVDRKSIDASKFNSQRRNKNIKSTTSTGKKTRENSSMLDSGNDKNQSTPRSTPRSSLRNNKNTKTKSTPRSGSQKTVHPNKFIKEARKELKQSLNFDKQLSMDIDSSSCSNNTGRNTDSSSSSNNTGRNTASIPNSNDSMGFNRNKRSLESARTGEPSAKRAKIQKLPPLPSLPAVSGSTTISENYQFSPNTSASPASGNNCFQIPTFNINWTGKTEK